MFVFNVFETGVELDAVDDFFPVAEGLASDPDKHRECNQYCAGCRLHRRGSRSFSST